MTRTLHRKPVTPRFHAAPQRQGYGSRLFAFLLSWTSAALIIGLTWGFGYLMYLLLLQEMAG